MTTDTATIAIRLTLTTIDTRNQQNKHVHEAALNERTRFTVRLSFLQIYHERVYDLPNPEPQPQTFGKLASLVESSLSYIALNCLSGAPVGVGGSDFIGYTMLY